ncbi:MAG TPA: prolyl oligopeptidase family serine peptidase [Candidatus Tumulicola sp.]|nr:prolyl oligopeptidase family serine peptidase [Candidatus Tumulicola sp.]HSC30982.1 prolyl oligopeptidase family serine peptidase [Gemmatimonadaceae bacterium]
MPRYRFAARRLRAPRRAARSATSLGLAIAVLGAAVPAAAQMPNERLQYPAAHRDSTVDDYFGARVPAPYRWMEDENSPEVRSWVEEENAVTAAYMDRVPLRDAFKKRLTDLWNYEKAGVPYRQAGRLFYSKNSGLQNQSVLYEQDRLGSAPRAMLDPNTLSPDGSTALAGSSVSPNGEYLAYGLSQGGSDFEELHVRSLRDGRDTPDTVRWVKFSGISWTADNRGFFYSRFPAPAAGQALSTAAVDQKVYYHVLGTPDSTDKLIYARPDLPDWYIMSSTTEDGRFAFITLVHGTDTKNQVFYMDLKDGAHPDLSAPLLPLVSQGDAEYAPLGNDGDTVFVQTTNQAPNRRVIAMVLPDTSRAHWRTVVPEQKSVLERATLAGGHIVAQYLEDVKSTLAIYGTDGSKQGAVALPGIGTVGGLSGRMDTPELFYSFSSFLFPATVYRYDFATKRSVPFQAPHVAFDASAYETRQVFYRSKDGTRVPMFITARKGLKLDGSHPTVLYAYGGFDISVTPSFSPTTAVWLEHGGIYAVASLRGGGEYGEAWHHAGMLDNKQNVFDDFIAAAEYLIHEHYTSTAHLAIHGYSNGGLLVGAVLDQRPDLFAAAYPGAGVMDMLRYQKFSAGVGWVPEYGSSDDSTQFKYLIKYSPVQNLKKGTCYPATIVTTADHDDRVVPSHSYKFIATMQADQSCARPVLIRVETKTSHGYMPTDKRIAQLADVWAFTGWNTGMR